MDSKETHQQQQQQNRNATAALAGPTSTSQAMHNRSSVGALSLRQPQPQPEQFVLNGSSTSLAVRGGEEGSFTAHVINVNAGEDIGRKLVAFMNQEPRDVCILSALGDVSVAGLQSNNPLRLVKYEGPYVITGMSGTFSNTESNGTVTRTGNLNVSLAGPDFKIVGGCVRGMLVAGSPVQVVVGIFGPERVKLSAASAPDNVLNSNGGGGPRLPQS